MSEEIDVLSQLASALRLEGAMSGRFTLAAPWGFAIPKSDTAALIVVVRGRVYFELREGGPRTLELGPGDVVALPHGHAHALRDDPHTPAEEASCVRSTVEDAAERHRGGQTELLLLACRFAHPRGDSLLQALPPLIHFAGHEGAVARWLDPTVRLLASESAASAPGRTIILNRLAEIVFLLVIRAWLDDATECKGRLRALRDSRIPQALSAIHAEPDRSWTVATLAGRAGMSRSAFASRFKELLGETPLDYLTRWRMQRAAILLQNDEVPLKEVVSRSGYVSEAAFRIAFRKWSGETPGNYREKLRAGAAEGIGA